MGRPRKQPEFPFESDQLVEATMSFTTDIEGVEYTFNSKSRPVRADHPAVIGNPHLFRALDSEFVKASER